MSPYKFPIRIFALRTSGTETAACRKAPPGAAAPHENYVLLNLRLSYDLLDWLQLFINMENLTDTRYTIIYGYEMPGITATGGFRVHF